MHACMHTISQGRLISNVISIDMQVFIGRVAAQVLGIDLG